MTERLDRIEALLLATAERQNEMNASLQQTQATLDRTAAQQAKQADEIDTLLGAVSTNEVSIRALVEQMAESNRRFDILRAETIADRAEWRAGFDAQQEVLQRMLLELHSTNGAVAGLSDRVDGLEQAS